MMRMCYTLLSSLLLLQLSSVALNSEQGQQQQRPNIVFIMVDDLGWNDIGYHGSEIQTPILDNLAANGVKLENYYTAPVCGPTRAQFLTGRYSIHMGTNRGNFIACRESGVPTNFPTIADKLKELNYSTNLVGKWHAGFHTESHLPTNRGFDTFRGFLLGHGDHYKHTRNLGSIDYLDYYDNTTPYNQSWGEYSTHIITDRAVQIIEEKYGVRSNKSESMRKGTTDPLFLFVSYQAPHNPLQVPEQYLHQYKHIKSTTRKNYAAMVTAIDTGIGKIIDSLKASGAYDNSVIIFSSDNGGDDGSGGNNFPLKGRKGSFYEGGIRAVAFVASPIISKPKRSVADLMHITDWMPTLLHLAGLENNSSLDTDGFNQWSTISSAAKSERTEILHNIKRKGPTSKKELLCASSNSTVSKGGCLEKGSNLILLDKGITAALTVGRWKILTGRQPGNFHHTNPVSDLETWDKQRTMRRVSTENLQVYNIVLDPEERYNMANYRPDITSMLLERLRYHHDNIADSVLGWEYLKNCNPALHGGVWRPFMGPSLSDDLPVLSTKSMSTSKQ